MELMSSQIREKPTIIDRKTIVPKSFYIRAEKASYNPAGIIKMYRNTRSSPNPPKGLFTYQAVRIKSPEELSSVKLCLDWLAGQLNWKELPAVLEEFKKQVRPEADAISPETLQLVTQYPDAATEILKGFDKIYRGHLEAEDFPIVSKVVNIATSLLSNQTKQMTESKIELLEKLGEEESPEGIQRLTKQLEEYDLPQLTSVAGIITDRLQKLRLLEATIQNENAYEIKGKQSVHKQLARAFWIFNDSYWLLCSNEPLASFLNKKYPEATTEERLRPDFICANDQKNLVIVEIKRPSHTVTKDDINQVQDYLISVDEYYPSNTFEKKGYIMAKNVTPHIQKKIDDTKSVEFMSYTRLVTECRQRYQEYLKVFEKES
jgi:hypothetical protein